MERRRKQPQQIVGEGATTASLEKGTATARAGGIALGLDRENREKRGERRSAEEGEGLVEMKNRENGKFESS